MLLSLTKAAFDAGVVAAGLAAADCASQAVGGGCDVMPLTMAGLKYLRWTLRCDVPTSDLAILQCNLLAKLAGVTMAWPQT